MPRMPRLPRPSRPYPGTSGLSWPRLACPAYPCQDRPVLAGPFRASPAEPLLALPFADANAPRPVIYGHGSPCIAGQAFAGPLPFRVQPARRPASPASPRRSPSRAAFSCRVLPRRLRRDMPVHPLTRQDSAVASTDSPRRPCHSTPFRSCPCLDMPCKAPPAKPRQRRDKPARAAPRRASRCRTKTKPSRVQPRRATPACPLPVTTNLV
jgi:hypothetical protein